MSTQSPTSVTARAVPRPGTALAGTTRAGATSPAIRTSRAAGDAPIPGSAIGGSVQELQITLRGSTGPDQALAVMQLAAFGPAAAPAVADLAHALHNGGGRLVHWAAAHALGQIGPPAAAARDALVRAAKADPSDDVRAEAKDALRRVTGKS